MSLGLIRLLQFYFEVDVANALLIAATVLNSYQIEETPICTKASNVVLEGYRASDQKHVAIKIFATAHVLRELLVLDSLSGQHHIVKLVESIALPNALHVLVLEYHNPKPFFPTTSQQLV